MFKIEEVGSSRIVIFEYIMEYFGNVFSQKWTIIRWIFAIAVSILEYFSGLIVKFAQIKSNIFRSFKILLFFFIKLTINFPTIIDQYSTICYMPLSRLSSLWSYSSPNSLIMMIETQWFYLQIPRFSSLMLMDHFSKFVRRKEKVKESRTSKHTIFYNLTLKLFPAYGMNFTCKLNGNMLHKFIEIAMGLFIMCHMLWNISNIQGK